MPCYHPLTAYRRWATAEGRWGGVFFTPSKFAQQIQLPCGQCIGCRIDRADQWATRVMHEASAHEHNSFLTLTYDDDHLPADSGLHYPHFQGFMRRLRKHGPGIRFYMCGEYGEHTKRPHYHAALFNFDFTDRVPLKRTPSGNLLFYSALLSSLWPFGHSSLGELTYQSAAYIARYVVKKINGAPAKDHYTRVDPETGEIHQVSPEFTRMSLKPGIGANWIQEFHSDVYPTDRINTQGRLRKPPRYYDNKLEVLQPDTHSLIKARRTERAIANSEDNTAPRLAVKETIALARNSILKRSLE